MSMIDISTLLGRYKDILDGDDEKRKRCISVINEITGLTLDPNNITFKKNAIVLRGNTVIKNELFMHKNRIVEALHKQGMGDIFEIN